MPPPSSIINFLWSVFHKPGLDPRKENTELFTSLLACSPTNGKKNRMISVCSSLGKCSQHANGSHMASELSHPFRVQQDLKTTSNSQEMDFWPSLEMSNEAFIMTDLPTRIQLVSASPVHPEGWEGRKDSDTLIQVTMLGYSLFSTIVFKMHLR